MPPGAYTKNLLILFFILPFSSQSNAIWFDSVSLNAVEGKCILEEQLVSDGEVIMFKTKKLAIGQSITKGTIKLTCQKDLLS